MATSSNMTPLPPSVLTVYLRLHFRSHPMQWTFYQQTSVQYQLDNALQSYTSFTAHQFHDAIGSTAHNLSLHPSYCY
ncbi:hypothetical protein Q9L58_005610 [Maublancomyces gigas]|uniref:Uncharacterized protein n=1 Tax=Discina gigas TaxID=1032678 RepID=A0ABR3GHK6_9PEZI